MVIQSVPQRDLRLLEVRFSPSKRVTKELLGGWQVVALNVLSKVFLVTGTWNLVHVATRSLPRRYLYMSILTCRPSVGWQTAYRIQKFRWTVRGMPHESTKVFRWHKTDRDLSVGRWGSFFGLEIHLLELRAVDLLGLETSDYQAAAAARFSAGWGSLWCIGESAHNCSSTRAT